LFRKFARLLTRSGVCIALAIFAYLGAALVGAVVPLAPVAYSGAGASERIYLIANWLHADFAIPVDDELRQRFAFLGTVAGMPISDPRLKYLVFGWGSRAFYTTAPTYADIRPGPTLQAVVGDRPVVHVRPAGDISSLVTAHALDLPPGGLNRLVDYIEDSFAGGSRSPHLLAQAGYGFGDEFFLATGHFNIFNPCNVWVARGLRQAGLATGAWTPTTFSLLLGIRLHSSRALDVQR
jgi:uncharacterized protein (TIGR02117 family)